ncbi:hypothetical protein Efla_006351 [Eimeria flavescens]
MADFFTTLVGGVVGAVVAVDVPADGERAPRPAPGTEWSTCCYKLHESARELDGFVQQFTFIIGKLACCMRVGVEHLGRSLSEGRAPSPSCCLMDKSEVDQSIDAGKQGGEALLRGGRLALEALFEGAKVAARRALIAAEATKEVVLRNAPYTQEKISQAYQSFLRGYQSGGRSLGGGYSSYQAPSYGQPQHQRQEQQQPSYGAPPPSSQQQPSGGFFCTQTPHSRRPRQGEEPHIIHLPVPCEDKHPLTHPPNPRLPLAA